MNCKQAEELLPLYAGRDLEEKRATLVTKHVQTCAACARVADQCRQSVQMTEQFAPPVFSEAVYTGIRRRVLREIQTQESAGAQTITSLFRPGLTWAGAVVLLIVVSMFAIYFIVDRQKDEQQLAHEPPARVQPGPQERAHSGPHQSNRLDLAPLVQTGGKKQQVAADPPSRRKRSSGTLAERMSAVGATSPEAISLANTVSDHPGSLPEPTMFPDRDSAALPKTLRVEIQTKDPQIRIIWFVPPETKPVIRGSKGT
jgi:hypothetical protein